MKKIVITILITIIFLPTYTQSPEKLSFQAVVRNSNNQLVTSQQISLRISILQGATDGTEVYIETQSPVTNLTGLFSVEIGDGNTVYNFSDIDWSDGPYFIKTEIDPSGVNNYTITNVTQLLSVPYALYAKTAENLKVPLIESDPVFESSIAYGISGSDTSKWNSKLNSFTESDPVFSASVSSGISDIDTSNWNNKLDEFVESDPVFDTSVASYITRADTSRWNNKPDGITENDPLYSASVAASIDQQDTVYWNNKLDSYTETQNLADVASIDNSVNTQLKNVTDPTDDQDAATKSYVTLRITPFGDTLYLGQKQWIIIPGISTVNKTYVPDIDGNKYSFVTIGSQGWLVENLRTTRYNDGTPITKVTDDTEWAGLSTPGYCWYDHDSISYSSTYGALYNWYAVDTIANEGKNICPAGWHVPSDDEWDTLTTYLGGLSDAGGKLKESGTTHWNSPNTGATNETSFSALPGGLRYEDGYIFFMGYYGTWWTSTQHSTVSAYYRSMSYDTNSVTRVSNNKERGLSVRCVKD